MKKNDNNEKIKKKFPNAMCDETFLKFIKLSQFGNESAYEFLINYFDSHISNIIQKNKLWVSGFDNDDIYQEFRMVVAKAIKNFNPSKINNKNSTTVNIFKYLIYKMCRARLITLIQESNRYKRRAMLSNVSLDTKHVDHKYGEYCIYDILPNNSKNVAEYAADKQARILLLKKIDSYLTKLEKSVFHLMIDGYSYAEISKILNIDIKSVDNALQRTKKKIKNNMKEILSYSGFNIPKNNKN